MKNLTRSKIWSREFEKATGTTWHNWNPVRSCTKYRSGCQVQDCWAADESQFQKKFPAKPSNILACWQAELSTVSSKWVQRIIDRIERDNREREAKGKELHKFFFLTKWPEYYANFVWPSNCWLGFTAINQQWFDKKTLTIHDYFTTTTPEGRSLLFTHFFCMLEPLEGCINLKNKKISTGKAIFPLNWLKWVIVGGGSQPLDPVWVRSIRDQCEKENIPFHFKSWGEWLNEDVIEIDSDIFENLYNNNPDIKNPEYKIYDGDEWGYWKVGKSKTGNILDGKKYLGGPQ